MIHIKTLSINKGGFGTWKSLNARVNTTAITVTVADRALLPIKISAMVAEITINRVMCFFLFSQLLGQPE